MLVCPDSFVPLLSAAPKERPNSDKATLKILCSSPRFQGKKFPFMTLEKLRVNHFAYITLAVRRHTSSQPGIPALARWDVRLETCRDILGWDEPRLTFGVSLLAKSLLRKHVIFLQKMQKFTNNILGPSYFSWLIDNKCQFYKKLNFPISSTFFLINSILINSIKGTWNE